MGNQDLNSFFTEKITEAKKQFERTIDCKHTEFDTLYPYMSEQPQFFWYKRYVAWQELLTTIKLSEDLEIDWKSIFTKKQAVFIMNKVLDAKVLDEWYEDNEVKKNEENSSINKH